MLGEGLDTVMQTLASAVWAVVAEILAYAPVAALIVLLIGLFFAGRIIVTIRRAVLGSSGGGASDPYQNDFLFIPLLFQGPVITLPTIADSDVTDFVGNILSWSPIQLFLTAMISIAVVGMLLASFRSAISK